MESVGHRRSAVPCAGTRWRGWRVAEPREKGMARRHRQAGRSRRGTGRHSHLSRTAGEGSRRRSGCRMYGEVAGALPPLARSERRSMMPCVYDDVPGSWARQSEGWPEIHDPDQKARMLVIQNKLVPYGSYVTVGVSLRLEKQEYVEKVLAALTPPAATPRGDDMRAMADMLNPEKQADTLRAAADR